jgi:hypothetical protein
MTCSPPVMGGSEATPALSSGISADVNLWINIQQIFSHYDGRESQDPSLFYLKNAYGKSGEYI